MKSRSKFILVLVSLTIITLACATLTGNEDTPAPPIAILPTYTPLPPLPTSTPLPPVPESTPFTPPNYGSEVLFSDDFSDPTSGWDQTSSEHAFTDYENAAYKILVSKTNYYTWANPYMNFGDQIIDVQANLHSSEWDNQFGIICRHQDVDNYYALVISSDGFAAIRKRAQGNELDYLTDWVKSPAINQANNTNNLHAECVGTRLALYVNDILVIEAEDAEFPEGDAGLMAGTFESTFVEVLFDDFQVSAP